MSPVRVPADAAKPRPAATLLLLRDGDAGLEVLMMRRPSSTAFAANMWVFPGGVVEPEDAAPDPASWSGIDPETLAPRFGVPAADVLGMHIAAVRETFEEVGILLAQRRPDGGLVWDLGALRYFARWVTPIQEPRRYDTAFFVAAAPADQQPAHDKVEAVEHRWVVPRRDREALPAIFPTQRTLERLASFDDTAAVLAHATAQAEVRSVQPHITLDDDGRYTGILHPDDPGYPHELYAGRS